MKAEWQKNGAAGLTLWVGQERCAAISQQHTGEYYLLYPEVLARKTFQTLAAAQAAAEDAVLDHLTDELKALSALVSRRAHERGKE